jgi:hypothetical protein
MLQIQALRDATQFHVGLAAYQFQGNLFAAVADRKVDLTETATAHPALDGVAV